MNRIGSHTLGRFQNALDVQIRGPDRHRFVRRSRVCRGPVRVRTHSDGRNPQLVTRAGDPDRDLPPVGN